jgi:hypothetical protein
MIGSLQPNFDKVIDLFCKFSSTVLGVAFSSGDITICRC